MGQRPDWERKRIAPEYTLVLYWTCCITSTGHMYCYGQCFFFFLKEFLFVVKVAIIPSIGRCRRNDNYPKEDLAKSGYKSKIYYKSLIILLYFWLYNENQIYIYIYIYIYQSGDFEILFFSFLILWQLKTSKITFF